MRDIMYFYQLVTADVHNDNYSNYTHIAVFRTDQQLRQWCSVGYLLKCA